MSQTGSHYTVLARRFRPQAFADVVGQQHIATALQNAIRSDRVAHAYLFTGARGVGKTSMARILAKALNCPNANDGVPCNDCDICDGISTGSDVDILEIDGASNRGIDDIRSLRANVTIKSMRTPYKIYIIDEVHMLTREAFNALLKTLEEPPEKVKFVFCTTEPNKVPDTILSRCQRFDFSTIDTANITIRLEQIAEAEGFEVEPEAIELVARRAAGSMRDSQSLFDQVLAFGDDHVSAQDVHRLLGTADDERLIAMFDALSSRQQDVALRELDQAVSGGVQLSEFVDQLIHYTRDLMVLATGAHDVALLSVSSLRRDHLQQQAELWGLNTVLAVIQILSETKTRMFRASYGRALVESALIRISLLEDLQTIVSYIETLKSGTLGELSSAPKLVASSASAPPQKKTVDKPAEDERSSLTEELAPGLSVDEKPDTNRSVDQKSDSGVIKSGQQKAESLQNRPEQIEGEQFSHVVSVPFQPGMERELLEEIQSYIEDNVSQHLRNAALAISGPNELDLTFNRSYNFSKSYCERPEIQNRLTLLLRKITGKSIRIVLHSRSDDSSEMDIRKPVTKNQAVTTPIADDPFLEQAKTVFQAKQIKVEPLES